MSSASSSEPLSAPTSLSTNDLTYGVELEFVFAFREDLIVFTNDADYTVLKDIPYSTRQLRFSRINSTFSPNRSHNSWVVQSSRSDHTGNKLLQPWGKEPLQIVANVLRQNIPAFVGLNASWDLDILDTLDNSTKKTLNWKNRYQWRITKDHSVCGVGSQNLDTWLPGKSIQADEWDSLGVELISPIMNSNTPGDMVRIEEIVNALAKDSPRTAAFITNQCGLHVHIQGPNSLQFQTELNMSEDDAERYKAKVWAEFALILLVYEDETARLHPPCRRPGHPNA
ncbi:uncharacterized protein RCO7_09654 [Rhynchosporium graminicola]|uniref:Amidoligase enzyme n=1 Tax=Rhynchosporium graminicola TaxID=2792576 RepID=A0A1E1L971_9HELO|nr:uncharacterized protein RCO7_09654 [Rhynchosporium commune]